MGRQTKKKLEFLVKRKKKRMESYYTQSVNEWYVSLLRANFQKHSAGLAALKTREDAVKYQQNVF